MMNTQQVEPRRAPVFQEPPAPVESSGVIEVLGHRALGAMSTVGIAVAGIHSEAVAVGDDDVVRACNEVFALLDCAARTTRDRIVLRQPVRGRGRVTILPR